MVKKIIAFGASNNTQSINKQLVQYVLGRLKDVEKTLLDLNNFELPLYSIDLQKSSGIPKNAVKFLEYIKNSDAIVISLAEYNGLYTTAFKNLCDWMSRIESPKIWHDKPMFLIGTSPSKKENSYVMKISKDLFPLFGAQIISSFHLPSFNHFFKDHEIIEPNQKELFDKALEKFQIHLNKL